MAAALLGLLLGAGHAWSQVRPTYLYNLSNFSGPLAYDGVRLHVDVERDESYVIYQDIVRIFSASGMESYSFGDDLRLGHILDAAVDANGDVLLLSYKDSRSVVTRCNFRGVPVGGIEIRGLPDGLAFAPNRMILRNGLLYFALLGTSSVVITDVGGQFRQYIEFLPLLDAEDRKKGDTESIGFAVDKEGNIFFTMPTLFKVYKYSAADGKLAFFGRSGSAPGRFGVLGGIAVDSRGNLLVADKLKCVVIAFDKDFNFLTEWGYRGTRPENLVIPDDVAIDRQDRLYVSQSRRRGVSVFALAPK